MHCFPELIADFSDVGSLDEAQAAALTQPDAFYGLRLDGLRQVSATVAAILVAKNYTFLSLDGILDLSTDAAAELSQFSGILSLRGLTALSPGAAEALGSSHAYHRFLHGLADLDASTAAALAANQRRLSLNGLRTMTADVARALCRCEVLYLDGLVFVSDEVGIVLGSHRGFLTLQGLREVSEFVARELARHDGWLSLAGATDLTPECRASLSANPRIYLPGAP